MCRIDERVYVRADGHESVFQDTALCERGRRRGKTCSDAKVRRTEYPDPTSSPMASSPITPTYNTRTRRPSVSSRPSTRDGSINSLKPEIHIEIGSKGKGKSYVPTVSITTRKGKRLSTGSTSGSDASHAVRTGYPDVSPPPLKASHGTLRPHYAQQRHPSSDESFTGSSRVPSLYQTSDGYDTPSLITTTTGASNDHRPIIHHGARGRADSPASPYLTTEFKPSSNFDETPARDQRNVSNYAPEITGRDEDRQRRRAEEKRRQEALDREYAASTMREENQKRVHFQKSTNAQPSQKSFTAREQRQAEEKETLRQRKKQQDEQAAREAAAAKDAAAKRSKPTTIAVKPPQGSAKMTAAQAAEQRHLVAAEAYQMQQERIKSDALEREEQRFQQSQPTTLHQRQKDPGYYDPRGERTTQPPVQQPPAPPIIRRRSQSGQQRPDLDRRTSTRDRQERRAPPVAYYNNTNNSSSNNNNNNNNNPPQNLPPARERRGSVGHNPFASPSATAAAAAAAAVVDPWDHRAMSQTLPGLGQSLPTARGPQVGHNFPQPQPQPQTQTQQASRRLNQAFYPESGYDQDEVYSRRR